MVFGGNPAVRKASVQAGDRFVYDDIDHIGDSYSDMDDLSGIYEVVDASGYPRYVSVELVESRGGGYGTDMFLNFDRLIDSGEVRMLASRRAACRVSRILASSIVDLDDGYTLHVYDSGEMQIKKHRPYVFGDTAYAISFDGGKSWQIRMEHETAFSHSVDVVDTVVCRTSDFSDIVFLVEEWDNDPSNKRFVDKW